MNRVSTLFFAIAAVALSLLVVGLVIGVRQPALVATFLITGLIQVVLGVYSRRHGR